MKLLESESGARLVSTIVNGILSIVMVFGVWLVVSAVASVKSSPDSDPVSDIQILSTTEYHIAGTERSQRIVRYVHDHQVIEIPVYSQAEERSLVEWLRGKYGVR